MSSAPSPAGGEALGCGGQRTREDGEERADGAEAAEAAAEVEEEAEEAEEAEGAPRRDERAKNCVHERVDAAGESLSIPGAGGADDGAAAAAAAAGVAPAKEYAFELDPFQRASIECIERGENVLVAAHTSAGKTVVAEYAVAAALRSSRRVIYTSPLKALSNQKFRELQEDFHDVGLLTGDVSVRPEAACLVMTTEVLRSMLYRGSEVTDGCDWVIFDEVHYLRDRERGVAWEESIILCPRHARLVFLSATIPNAREFASWVARTHGSVCNVVSTDYRPTPLQHFAFPSGGDNLYMTVDDRGRFLQSNFRKAIVELQHGPKAADAAGGRGRKRKADADGAGAGKAADIFKVVSLLMARGLDPVIIFSFSKRDCETLSVQMTQVQLIGERERRVIEGVFESAMDTLSDADRRLPQVTRILPLLLRGVGVHHGGMMPIVKEVTELLFQEGLLKVLFATETFSTGLNMPARTVVMTGVRKFDGSAFRMASSGEYIQMSGRAGRRGLDDRGIVILMLGEKVEPEAARAMMRGAPDPLVSAYHLTYHAMLNTVRRPHVRPPLPPEPAGAL